MKKVLFGMIVLFILGAAGPLFAQRISEGKESEYYYVTVPVERVYPYRKGYVVSYRKSIKTTGLVYLPEEWFNGTDGMADMIHLPPGKTWPHMMIYYKNGEFSHVRVYVHRLKSHITWGNVPLTVNIDDRFADVKDVKIEFE
jgi:hypothetical protein